MLSIVSVKRKHVSFVQIPVHVRLLSPIVVANLLPDLSVERLLRSHLSPQQILTKTAVALEGSHYDSWGLRGQITVSAARQEERFAMAVEETICAIHMNAA